MSHIEEIQRLADVQEAHDKLARFGAAVLKACRDPQAGSLDGGDLEQMALEAGVLVTRTVTEACGEGCVCADYGAFPLDCHFAPDPVATLVDEMTKE